MVGNKSVGGGLVAPIVDGFAKHYAVELPVQFKLHLVGAFALVLASHHICFDDVFKFHLFFG